MKFKYQNVKWKRANKTINPMGVKVMYQVLINNLLKSEKGQTLTEYGLIILFVVVGVIASLSLFGTNLLVLFQNFIGAF
jgi:Flp pilus assembly pilin Flp